MAKNREIFKRIMKKALRKFEIEAFKHFDTWKNCPIAHLRTYMEQHVLKWKDNRFQLQKEKEISDLLDIINYCIMLIERLK